MGASSSSMSGMVSKSFSGPSTYTYSKLSHALGITEEEPKWMINGKVVTIEEFLDMVYPGDCPEKTYFILKYTDTRKEQK